MSTRRRVGNGRISVHTPEIIDDILGESAEHIESLKGAHRKSRSAVNRCRTPEEITERLDQTGAEQTFRIQNWLNEKSVRNIQERTDFESRATKNMYTSLLYNEGTFVKDVERYLDHKTFLDKRKKQMLHKKWSERVFIPIQCQIDSEMNGENYKNLDKRKRLLYKHYLDYSNKKGVVFLDVISPEEYDPLVLNANRPAPLKAVTHELDDCLTSQRKTEMDEDGAIIRCATGEIKTDKEIENLSLPSPPLVPLGRHGVQCKTWLRMQLHDIDSDIRKRSGQRMIGTQKNSTIDFDEITNSKATPELLDIELRSQKKRQYPERHASTVDFEWPELPSITKTTCQPRIPNVLPFASSFDYYPEYFNLNATF